MEPKLYLNVFVDEGRARRVKRQLEGRELKEQYAHGPDVGGEALRFFEDDFGGDVLRRAYEGFACLVIP